jgi:hypothetical protein
MAAWWTLAEDAVARDTPATIRDKGKRRAEDLEADYRVSNSASLDFTSFSSVLSVSLCPSAYILEHAPDP